MKLKLAIALLLAPLALRAECTGPSLIDALLAEERAALEARIADEPFARGNFWRATRGDKVVTIIGGFIPDRRQGALIERFSPLLDEAAVLVVEVSPAVMEVVKQKLSDRPDLGLSLTRPTLRDLLTDDEFRAYLQAMKLRGFSPPGAASLKPWLAYRWLCMPPCAASEPEEMRAIPQLEQFFTDSAASLRIPIRSLDTFEEALDYMTEGTQEAQMIRLRQMLASQPVMDAIYATANQAYYQGENRLFAEYEMAKLPAMAGINAKDLESRFRHFDDLTRSRAARWVRIIETSAEKGPVLLSLNVYYLYGEGGFLNQLAQAGWTLNPLDP